jgi:predicted nucleic acid-binding protein
VSITVLLETEWVLRRTYGYLRPQVLMALRGLAGLPTVVLEGPEVAAQALDWAEAGMDFADALHLAAAGGQGEFLTFDAKLIRVARRAGVASIATP